MSILAINKETSLQLSHSCVFYRSYAHNKTVVDKHLVVSCLNAQGRGALTKLDSIVFILSKKTLTNSCLAKILFSREISRTIYLS